MRSFESMNILFLQFCCFVLFKVTVTVKSSGCLQISLGP